MYKIILMLLLLLPNLCMADINILTNYDNAATLSQDTGMPLLVIFGSDNCPHCKNLVKDVQVGIFDDQLDGYIVCYVDTRSEKKLARELSVKGIPDSRIFRHKILKGKIVGYDKKSFKEWLQDARSK